MNQHYFDVPFAFAGDVTPIPDPLQTGGTVSMTEGWNYNYQRDLSTDPAALPIDRSTTNWLLQQITEALQAWQQASVPEFILSSQNGGVAFAYGAGSQVLWSASGNAPFGKYVNLTAGNTNTPSASDPQGLTTGWQLVVDPIATAAQASAGTNDASIMTPLKVAQQVALRALLAGNSAQVFNVGPATAGTQAPQFSQLTGLLGYYNLTINQPANSLSMTINFSEAVVETTIAAGALQYKAYAQALTVNMATIGAGGLDTGSVPASGYVGVYLIYNPTSNTWALLATNGNGLLSNTYAGSAMPAGYTASLLLTVWRTTAASQFQVGVQINRKVAIPSTVVASTTSQVPTQTTLSIAAAVPQNAKKCSGVVEAGSTTTSTILVNVWAGAGVQYGQRSFVWVGSSGIANMASFEDLSILSPQTISYQATTSAGSFSYEMLITEYEL